MSSEKWVARRKYGNGFPEKSIGKVLTSWYSYAIIYVIGNFNPGRMVYKDK
jgi:hypothetical protein